MTPQQPPERTPEERTPQEQEQEQRDQRPGPSARGDEVARYDATASAFVERFAADMTEAGMQRMGARVFACVLASDEGALTSAQLSERLRISPAAVSGAVRYLSQVRLVSREREPGSRRERYRVQEEVWFSALLDRDSLIKRWSATLQVGEQAVGADSRAGARIRETWQFMEYLQQELTSLLERWQEKRARETAPGAEPPPPPR